ncbi:capsid protein precursor pVI [Human adenovirus 12]|nr:capsid protein precursor pVI [Human adenovirus 12]WEG80019.1 capsid protein precursor pVI [Human adenovirus 12]
MEDINFSSLAPRHGTRPYMGTWNEIGTSQLNGGAFNWNSIWSGLKNFGSTIKTYGTKAWNSQTGQMLRDKLKDQNFQQKVVDGLASGINGVVDIANQAVQKKIANRLEPRPDEVMVEEKLPPLETVPGSVPTKGEKRPRPDAEETLVTHTTEPPSYEEAIKQGAALSPTTYPMTKPILPMATRVYEKNENVPMTLELPPLPEPTIADPVDSVPVASVPVTVSRPAVRPVAVASLRNPRSSNWQSTLNSIVGLGVKSLKRRRCY